MAANSEATTMGYVRMLTVLFAIGLSGCFVSKKPLIGDDQAVTPFNKITYAEKGSTDTTTLTKEGAGYVAKGKDGDGEGRVRFMKVGDNLYVAELMFTENGADHFLHSFLKVDPSARTAESYRVVADESDNNLPAGLSRCDEADVKQVCIERLDAYIDYAKAAITAGGKPEVVYQYDAE
jgi:hypothetical protein